MSRFQACMRGLVLAGAVAIICIPAAAQAGGGHKVFCGNFGGGLYGGGCYKPSYCYQPNYCYRPPIYCQPVYQPYVQTYCAPSYQVQPWVVSCHQPCYNPYFGGCGPIVIKCH